MADWYNALPVFFQVMFIVACVSSLVMLIQLILLIIGFGADTPDFDGGVDVPDDMVGDMDTINDEGVIDVFGLKILTIRNIFIFLSMSGWGMLSFYDLTGIIWLSIILGIIIGVAIVFLFSFAMKKAMLLQNEGNIDINNTVGKIGSVYLTIPGKKAGLGKVNVLVQERLQEFNAMTDDESDIKTGSEVTVVAVEVNYLIVKRKG